VRPNSSTLWLRNPHTDKGHLPFHAPLSKICDRAHTGATEAKSTSAAGRVDRAGAAVERDRLPSGFDDHVMMRGSEMDASRLEAVTRRRLLHGQRGGALEHRRQEARLPRMPMEDDRERRLKIGG
jgi:hypothetical protein